MTNNVEIDHVKLTANGVHIFFTKKRKHFLPDTPVDGVVYPNRYKTEVYAPYWYDAQQVLDVVRPTFTGMSYAENCTWETTAAYTKKRAITPTKWMRGSACVTSPTTALKYEVKRIDILSVMYSPSVPCYTGVRCEDFDRIRTKNNVDSPEYFAVLRAVLYAIHTCTKPEGVPVLFDFRIACPYALMVLNDPKTVRSLSVQRFVRKIQNYVNKHPDLMVSFSPANIEENNKFIKEVMAMASTTKPSGYDTSMCRAYDNEYR